MTTQKTTKTIDKLHPNASYLFQVRAEDDDGAYSKYATTKTKTKKLPKKIIKKPTPKQELYRGKRSYSQFSKNLVEDNLTGLIWQKGDDGKRRTWSEAKQYCSSLTLDRHNDFYLPTLKQLYYLANRNKYNPAIDTKYFNVRSSLYWSSTQYVSDTSQAWYVGFEYGNDGWSSQSNKHYALCVRDSI